MKSIKQNEVGKFPTNSMQKEQQLIGLIAMSQIKNGIIIQVSWKRRRCFCLGAPEDSVQIVPKRAFANESDLNQFREWASKIGQNDAPLTAPIPEP